MERRIAIWGLAGAVLLSIVWGSPGAAKPKFGIKRLSGTRGKAAAPAAEPIQWQHDLRSAHRVAQSTGRPILIVVCGPGCAPCRRLMGETFADPALAATINERFVPVHLDYQKEGDKRAAEILEVKALPTCVVLNPEADLLGSSEGFVRAPEFGKLLQQTLEFQRTLEAERKNAE